MPVSPVARFRPIQPALPPNVAHDGLVYREWTPATELVAEIACFWTIEGTDRCARPFPYRVVPDGCIDVVLDVGNGAGAWIYGTLDRPVVADLEGRVALFGTRIRPGRFGALVGPPAERVAGAVHDLAAVLGRDGTRWYAAARDALDTASRLAIAHAALTAMRATVGRVDGLAAAVADALVAAEAPRIEAVARRFGLSTRHLARLCRRATGLGPKRFARVIRAQRALRALRDATPATVAAQLGFADQAHLTAELRVLAGTTPGAVRRMSDFSKTASAAVG